MIYDLITARPSRDESQVTKRFRVLSAGVFAVNVLAIATLWVLNRQGVPITPPIFIIFIINCALFPWFNLITARDDLRRWAIYLWLFFFLVELSVIVLITNGPLTHTESLFSLAIISAGFLLGPRDIFYVTIAAVIMYLLPILSIQTEIITGTDIFGIGVFPLENPALGIILVTNILIFSGTGVLTSWTVYLNRQREKRLLKNQEQLNDAQRIARLVSWEYSIGTGKVAWSDVFYDLLGINPLNDMSDMKRFIDEYVHPEDAYILNRVVSEAENLKKTRNYEFRLLLPDGEIRNIRTEVHAIVNRAGEVTTLRGTMLDITDQRILEKELIHLAHYDELTDLVNRSLFYRDVSQLISNSKRDGRRFALLFLDLDGFKEINDTHGHDAGDITLKTVAARMSENVRENDIVARMGGDEFAIILQNISSPIDAEFVADKIIEKINEPIILADRTTAVKVGMSIGIALYPDHASTENELIKLADDAMYRAKSGGKNRHVLHGTGAE